MWRDNQRTTNKIPVQFLFEHIHVTAAGHADYTSDPTKMLKERIHAMYYHFFQFNCSQASQTLTM